VAEYPGYLQLRAWLGGRATTAATLLTALGLLVLLVPAVLVLGYKLLLAWVYERPEAPAPDSAAVDAGG